jgi:hypothetical protein
MNAPQTAAPQRRKMTLTSLVKGKKPQPPRVLIYGVEGIGKSSFAAGAPSPVFIGAEDGTAQLDVSRLPVETWQDILDAVDALGAESHEYKTVVLDTLDWAEPKLWEHICARDKQPNIEGYGYGKGYAAALDEWRILVDRLDRLRKARSMGVVLVAHSQIKGFKNPEGEDFDRYEMKLHQKAGGLFKEWADAVLFANYETVAMKDGRKRVRGVDTGVRLVHTERRAAFDAKNRYGLPETLPLSWSDFDVAVTANQPASPTALASEIQRKAEGLGGTDKKKALDAIKRAAGDAEKLAFMNNWVNAKLAEKEQENAE